MERVHMLMNIVLLPLTPIVLLIVLPPYLVFKIFRFAIGHLFPEKVVGKVILITGAASGIGEQIAYEYARRGAYLALLDKKEEMLLLVAEHARRLGSPEVSSVCADVSLEEDCKNAIEETINRFGRLDHLINNAGIAKYSMFEDLASVSKFTSIMKVNFWGQLYCTHFAIPHLKKSKGKIIAIASATGWYPIPKLNIYGPSKAALINFYETLRMEIGNEIGITVVTPSSVSTELFLQDNADTELGFIPKVSSEECAKTIVDGACRGTKYLVVPLWANTLFPLKVLLPDVVEYLTRLLIVSRNSHNVE